MIHRIHALERQFSRRTALRSGAMGLAVLAAGLPARAAANVIDVTSPPYNASPALPDNTPHFQRALDALLALGGGVLQVPPGYYMLQGPLDFSTANGCLTVMGYGSELSILVVKHAGTALNVTYTNPGDSQSLVVKDIGFSPAPGAGAAGTAVALTLQHAQSAWPSCRFEDVDFGVQYPNYTVFDEALVLTNVWRSAIVNCTAHGNSRLGGNFLRLSGTCVDNRVQACNIDGYQTGVAVHHYCEGLHVVDTVFIGGTALTTGSSDYNNGINLLGLYISGCEFNCQDGVLCLYQVNSAWISDTDFYGPRAATGSVACALVGSGRIKISNCLFGGTLDVGAPSNQIGIATSSSTRVAAFAITVDDCDFENTLVAISLGAGTENVTGLGVRMLAPGDRALVNTPVVYGRFTQQPLVDGSGNSTNAVQWLTTVGADRHTVSRRTVYSR